MLCDICKKNNAVIRIQKINNGKNVVVNLCADCAEKHKAHEHFEFGDIEIGEILENIKKITKNLNLQNVFVSAEELDDISKFTDDGKKLVKCPKCGFTLVDIDKNSGKLGCSECYKVFEKEVMKVIENMHRCKIHIGKHPIAVYSDTPSLLQEKIAKLEQDLHQAVQSEKYEQAAILRDELNLLKKNQIENE